MKLYDMITLEIMYQNTFISNLSHVTALELLKYL